MSKVLNETAAIRQVLSNEANKYAENSSARGRLQKAGQLVARGEFRRARTLCGQVAAHSRSPAADELAYTLTAMVLIQGEGQDHAASTMWSGANDLMNNCCDDAAIEVAVRGWAWRSIAKAALGLPYLAEG